MSRLEVLDGTAALFRAWFSVPSSRSPGEVEVGATRGLGLWLARFMKARRPTHVAVVFDAGTWTFRNQICSDYKANRGLPPDELEPQFDLSLALCRALGLRAFRSDGYEADDLMATLARRARLAGIDVALVTPDKDVLQLLSPHVQVLEPKRFEPQDAASVQERFGVLPEQLIDYLALAGDATDNVPGIRGIGPRTASALLQAAGSLDALLDDPDQVATLQIRGARTLPQKLRDGRDDALLSRRLVTLCDEAPLNPDIRRLGDLRPQVPDPEARATFFERVGFAPPF